ncbi:MAG: hypothetical protein ACQETB_05355 [Halobacteriota archaeon]
MGTDHGDEPFPVEVLAIPFVIGMSIGLAIGRVGFQSTALGAMIGLVLFVILAVGRVRLLPVRTARER